jgi:hypothetical protein
LLIYVVPCPYIAFMILGVFHWTWEGRMAVEQGESGTPQASVQRTAKGTRQRRHPGGRRHKYTVRLSDEEKVRVEARALVAGVSVPRLLVEAALADDARTLSERRALIAEFLGARRLVAAVSNNVARLAETSGSGAEVPRELAATLHAAARVMARLDAATEQLGGDLGGERR